jgi:hypothetical protein
MEPTEVLIVVTAILLLTLVKDVGLISIATRMVGDADQ